MKTVNVPWYEAVQHRRAVRRRTDVVNGEPTLERVVAAESTDVGGVRLLTDIGESIDIGDNGLIAVIDEKLPLKILAVLPDGTVVTLIRWLRERDDLETIQALDAGGGRLTMNVRAAVPDHPMRVRLDHPDAPTYEIFKGVLLPVR